MAWRPPAGRWKVLPQCQEQQSKGRISGGVRIPGAPASSPGRTCLKGRSRYTNGFRFPLIEHGSDLILALAVALQSFPPSVSLC